MEGRPGLYGARESREVSSDFCSCCWNEHPGGRARAAGTWQLERRDGMLLSYIELDSRSYSEGLERDRGNCENASNDCAMC